MSVTPDRYLVPRPRGVSWAVGSRTEDIARRLILDLLGGGSERPMDLAELAPRYGMSDVAAFGKLLFKLQRETFLTAALEPLTLPDAGSFNEAINDCLARFAVSGSAVLATDGGLCYGRAGASVSDANLISSTAYRMFSMRQRLRRAMSGRLVDADALDATGAYVIEDLQLMPVHTGSRLFYLVTVGQPDFTNGAYIALVSLLLRRYKHHAAN